MIHLVNFSTCSVEDLEIEKRDHPQRNITENMQMGKVCINKLRQTIIDPFVEKHKIGLYIATSYGEMMANYGFYKNLGQNHARPILFQNSLHNSTLGFLAQQYKLKAMGRTIVQGEHSAEYGIQACIDDLLLEKLDLAILFCHEFLPGELDETLLTFYPEGTQLKNGACCCVFATDEFVNRHRLISLAKIKDIQIFHSSPLEDESSHQNFYDSNVLELFTQSLDAFNQTKKLSLSRPGGGHVVFLG